MDKYLHVYAWKIGKRISIHCSSSNEPYARTVTSKDIFSVGLCSFELDDEFLIGSMQSVPKLFEAMQDIELAERVCSDFESVIAFSGINAARGMDLSVESKYGELV